MMAKVPACHLVLAITFLVSRSLGFSAVSPFLRHSAGTTTFTRLLAFAPKTPLDVSGSLISQLAEVAIKLRLADQTAVKCDVSSTPTDLMFGGKIGPVTVKGKGWRSGRGLTCRAIEATVQSCELDIGRIISNQKLVLTRPAEGRAMIAVNSEDFGNFITHPLMQPPKVTAGERPKFLKENTVIDPKEGTVVFYSDFRDYTWRCTLQRSSRGKAEVSVAPANHCDDNPPFELAEELSISLTNFFNELVFELDGTFLSYRDMMVTDKGTSPSVMLALDILVRKFPSPGVDF